MAKKEAEKFGLSDIMEGMISIRAVIRGAESGVNDRKIEKIIYDEARGNARAKELSYLRAMGYKYGFPVTPVPRAEIEALALGTSHGGILAVCTPRSFPEADTSSLSKNGFYVMLEGIEDPYNFGYCLRSLYAAGVSGIILEKHNWTGVAGIVARASAGASEMFDMRISEDFAATAAAFQKAGYTFAVADKSEKSKSVYDCTLRFPLLLAIGGERRGNTKAALERADEIIALDYGRDFPAALSAASAASVIAFEIFRQNRG